MEYMRLGNSGVKVSRICLGSNNFGGQLDEKASAAVIEKALDLGVNIIDTANTYQKGKSEVIIGRTLKGHRDDVIIATKVGMSVGEGPNGGGLSRKHIMWQIKRSLEQLQTDYIDIYYMHRFDPETPIEETLRTLNDLVHRGRVRYIACSNWDAAQIENANELCDSKDLEKIIAVQPPYNLLDRGAEEDLLPYCAKEHLGVLTYTPLMGGFLTGKYEKGKPPPPGSRGASSSYYWGRFSNEELYAPLERLKAVSSEVGIPLHKLSIEWILSNPTVTAPILGASTVEQVIENCGMVNEKLPDSVLERLNKAKKPGL
jgi:aryl-alcohol dehydrogenase-like predicted oxidoreductase